MAVQMSLLSNDQFFNKHDLRGTSSNRRRVSNPNAGQIAMQLAIRIVDWMSARRTVPTPSEIMAEFEVSRATAYRWLTCFCDARGIYRERQIEPNGAPGSFIPLEMPPPPKPRFTQWARSQAVQ